MGLVGLALRVTAAVILFLLAFQVITDDFLYWLAGAIGLYVTSTLFGEYGIAEVARYGRRE